MVARSQIELRQCYRKLWRRLAKVAARAQLMMWQGLGSIVARSPDLATRGRPEVSGRAVKPHTRPGMETCGPAPGGVGDPRRT